LEKDARLEARARGRNEQEVTLVCPPGASPAAWALSRAPTPDAPFRTDWHAERGTGRRPEELVLAAVVPKSPFVRARVYFVDGGVATPRVSTGGATAVDSRPTSWFEAPT
jgi:hypothetical protein